MKRYFAYLLLLSSLSNFALAADQSFQLKPVPCCSEKGSKHCAFVVDCGNQECPRGVFQGQIEQGVCSKGKCIPLMV